MTTPTTLPDTTIPGLGRRGIVQQSIAVGPLGETRLRQGRRQGKRVDLT